MNSKEKYLEKYDYTFNPTQEEMYSAVEDINRNKELPIRKDYPIFSGALSYFPKALKYISYISKVSNDKHNPNEPLHWARDKSSDHLDAGLRHLADHSIEDFDKDDGLRHLGKSAWRLLAELELVLEKENKL